MIRTGDMSKILKKLRQQHGFDLGQKVYKAVYDPTDFRPGKTIEIAPQFRENPPPLGGFEYDV